MTVERLRGCALRVVEGAWRFAAVNQAMIETHWQTAIGRNPALYDGSVFVLTDWSIDGGILSGRAIRAAFSQYLYWRETGFDGGATHEAFATTVIVAADGGVLLARAAAGTVNGGRYQSAGGFLDGRDVSPGGLLDPEGAAFRELREETGIDASGVVRDDGLLLVLDQPFLALASVLRYPGSGAELVDVVERFLAGEKAPELEAPCVVYDRAALDQLPTTVFARLLSETQLA